jgi:hypothetical protein
MAHHDAPGRDLLPLYRNLMRCGLLVHPDDIRLFSDEAWRPFRRYADEPWPTISSPRPAAGRRAAEAPPPPQASMRHRSPRARRPRE